jgi:ABC-type oligopeptide transport system ATPase subunit
MPEEILSVKDVSKTFQVKAGDVTAVDQVSFTAAAGQVTTIVGPSGSGKTTLLYVVG